MKGVMETEILVLSEVMKTDFYTSISLEWEGNSWRFLFSSILTDERSVKKKNYRKKFFSFVFVSWTLLLQHWRTPTATEL